MAEEKNPGNTSEILLGMETAKGRRPNIEDRTEARHLTTAAGLPLTVAMVADGIGGNDFGELAAELAIKTTFNELEASTVNDPAAIPELLAHALTRANEVVYKTAREDRAKRNMGTTATIAAIHKNRLYLANVGDSRAYLLRDGHAKQLTRDHIWARVMTQQGRLSAEEAAEHPKAGELVRSIGYDPEVNVDLGLYLNGEELNPTVTEEEARREQGLLLRTDDRLVLCSDGLIKERHDGAGQYVEEAEMLQLVTRFAPDKAATALVSKAISRNADDNVSAVVLEMPGSKRAFYIPPKLIGAGAAGALLLALIVMLFLFPGGGDEPVAAAGTPLANATSEDDTQPADNETNTQATSGETVEITVHQGAPGAHWRTGDRSGPLEDGETLQVPGSGSLSVTGGDDVAILIFPDQARLVIEQAAKLEITLDENNPQIKLQKGVVLLVSGSELTSISSPYGALGSSEDGTVAISYTEEPFSFEVSCLLGSCQITGDMSGETTLAQGEASTVGGAGEPEPIEPVHYEQFTALNATLDGLNLALIPTATATPTTTATPTATVTPTATATQIPPTVTPIPTNTRVPPTAAPPEPSSPGDDGGNDGGDDNGGDDPAPPPPPTATTPPEKRG